MSATTTLDDLVASRAEADGFVRTRWWWICHAPVVVDGGRILRADRFALRLQRCALIRRSGRASPARRSLDHEPSRAHPSDRAGDLGRRSFRPGAGIYPGQGPCRATSRRLARARSTRVSLEPQTSAGFVLVCDSRRTCAERRKFRRSPGASGATIGRINQTHPGGDVVAVAHGGTIRAAITLALGLAPGSGFAFMIDNCSLTRARPLQRPANRRMAGQNDQSAALLTRPTTTI